MESRKFAELGLSPELLKAVDKMGFEEASVGCVCGVVNEGGGGVHGTGSGGLGAEEVGYIDGMGNKRDACTDVYILH
jgi:ATP-dependent RNA helicase DeaD